MGSFCSAFGCGIPIVDSGIPEKQVLRTTASRIVAAMADVGPFGNSTIECLENETVDIEVRRVSRPEFDQAITGLCPGTLPVPAVAGAIGSRPDPLIEERFDHSPRRLRISLSTLSLSKPASCFTRSHHAMNSSWVMRNR